MSNPIEQLRKLVEARAKATGGPWENEPLKECGGASQVEHDRHGVRNYIGPADDLTCEVPGEYPGTPDEKSDNDAAFIALAGSTDFPAILADYERQKSMADNWTRLYEMLLAARPHSDKPDPHVEALLDKLQENKSLKEEMERLRAIVDKLPKYADTGEPILMPCKAWIVDSQMSWLSGYEADHDEAHVLEVQVWNRNKDHYAFSIFDPEPDFADGPIYSTRAAAEAAKGSHEHSNNP